MSEKFILASASPRRTAILSSHGIDAQIIPADVSEDIAPGTAPHLACMYNALKKALCVEEKVENGIIIAADTIVFCDRILGKPTDEKDAFEMLKLLRDGTHQVMTGVALVDAQAHLKRVFAEKTDVTFGTYSDRDILEYIATGEPDDKAGSYAIQGGWASHVTCVKGDFENVIGLPWKRLSKELKIFSGHL